MSDLDALENQSIYILREAFSRLKPIAMLWSLGKDSNVMLWLARKAFLGHVPFPVVHVDTGKKFPEMYEFRERFTKTWNLNLIVATFALTILGTFLTRSGVLSSVHAFGEGPIGFYFLAAMAIVLLLSFVLVAGNSDKLATTGQLEGVALVGHATLMETVSDRALALLAAVAQQCPNMHMIMGEKERVADFWSYYASAGRRQRLACREW
jgi:hypothetical protein